ncbi:hypothetical protein Q5752_006674 [Cryptotrichosporon argae]
MPFQGTLDLYPAGPSSFGGTLQYPFFTSGPADATRAVVFIGGLTNGLASVPYLEALGESLHGAGWKLVQPHWSSAYDGYGTGSLDRDVSELSSLVTHLRAQGLETIVLMGHSTGSQDVIHYVLTSTAPVDGGIMQAPVSDREYFAVDTSDFAARWTRALPEATRLVEAGRGAELLPREFEVQAGFRMSAYRLWSLLSPVGDDDYFSTDIPLISNTHPHPLAATFGKLDRPVLALFSEKDEFRPATAGLPTPEDVLARWAQVSNGRLEWRIIPGASHAVEQDEARGVMIGEVLHWLKRFE